MCVPVIGGLGGSGESFWFVGSWGGVLFAVLFCFFPFLPVASYKSREKHGLYFKAINGKSCVWKSPGEVNRLIELFQLDLRKRYNDQGF